MVYKNIKLIFGYLFILSCLGNLNMFVNAQPADIAVAIEMNVAGNNIQKGSIVTNNGNEIRTSNSRYDETLYGVVVENPSISIGKKNDSGKFSVATSGTVQVLVNSENGIVKKGDYITSSSVEGVGMRARIPGRVVGIALEDMPETESAYILKVSVRAEYVTAQALYNNSSLDGDIRDYDGNPFGTNTIQTRIITYLKYASSGLLALSGFVFSIIYYTQLSKKEVDAIGRNPMATSALKENMRRNGVIAIFIALSGFALAFLILRI